MISYAFNTLVIYLLIYLTLSTASASATSTGGVLKILQAVIYTFIIKHEKKYVFINVVVK